MGMSALPQLATAKALPRVGRTQDKGVGGVRKAVGGVRVVEDLQTEQKAQSKEEHCVHLVSCNFRVLAKKAMFLHVPLHASLL